PSCRNKASVRTGSALNTLAKDRIILGKYQVFLSMIDMTLGTSGVIESGRRGSSGTVTTVDKKSPITGFIGKPLFIFHHHRDGGKLTLEIPFATDRLRLAHTEQLLYQHRPIRKLATCSPCVPSRAAHINVM